MKFNLLNKIRFPRFSKHLAELKQKFDEDKCVMRLLLTLKQKSLNGYCEIVEKRLTDKTCLLQNFVMFVMKYETCKYFK